MRDLNRIYVYIEQEVDGCTGSRKWTLMGLCICVQVREILDTRTREEARCVLGISVYDVARNETAKKHRIELVRMLHVCMYA